ncbi:PIN domain-containing protein [Opitutaceae bacterium]|nr:PIN domain-containing protein [Opitutaceae bacterium]
MANLVILDTGPMVALLNRRDKFHDWVKRELSQIDVPIVSCEAVFSEASYLMRGTDYGFRRLCALASEGLVELNFSLSSQFESVATLLRKYQDTPMSFADACVVRMSEVLPHSKVLTIDSDFLHYRRNGRNVIPLIYPGSKK